MRFVAAGSLALLLVGAATVFVSYQVSRDVALRHAQSRGTTFARYVAAPLVNERVRASDPEALAVLTKRIRDRLHERTIAHVRIWDRDGRVLWADEPGVRGRVLSEDGVDEVFRSRGAMVSMSEGEEHPRRVTGLRAPELLEVYVWSRDGDSRPIVVESYWATDQIDSDVRAIMMRIAPLPLVALLLFVLAMFPLGWSLARRVDRAQAESKRSLQHALSAADLERRRIARDLHDGVMQDVSGAGYALSAVSTGLPDDAETPRRLVGEVSRLVRQVGESLRSLVADIYPPNLSRDGLAVAVEDLADRAADHGVDVLVDIPVQPSRDLPIEVAQLCYRVIREALRNVERHAQASHAEVRAVLDHGVVRITVTDDGRGPGQPKDDNGPAHLGLRLLEDTLKDLGGTLSLEPGPSGGAVFTATVPLQVDFV